MEHRVDVASWKVRVKRGSSMAAAILGLTTSLASAQISSPFDPPPMPGQVVGSAPQVRGLYNPQSPPTSLPSAPAGAEQAPSATFVRPASPPLDATGDRYGLNAAAPPPSTETSGDPAAAVEPTPIEGTEIVARVNGDVILASDFNWQIDQIVMTIESKGQKIPPNQMVQFRQMFMRRLVLQQIDSKLLYNDFRHTVPAEALPKVESGLTKPFEEIELPRLYGMLKVKDRVELEALLAKSGTSVKDIQRAFVERTIASEWLKQKLPKSKEVTYEEILAYYQDHLKEYEEPAQARWEELAARFDRFDGDRDKTWQAVCEMGNDVWARVQQSPNVTGPVFAETAKAKSQGFTAADGGVHDWTTLGALKCEGINDALAELQLGQMSDGIESEQGFHIVRVLERKPAGRKPFTEAQVEIRKLLLDEQRTAAFEEALGKVRKGARVWIAGEGDMTPEDIQTALRAMQKR